MFPLYTSCTFNLFCHYLFFFSFSIVACNCRLTIVLAVQCYLYLKIDVNMSLKCSLHQFSHPISCLYLTCKCLLLLLHHLLLLQKYRTLFSGHNTIGKQGVWLHRFLLIFTNKTRKKKRKITLWKHECGLEIITADFFARMQNDFISLLVMKHENITET